MSARRPTSPNLAGKQVIGNVPGNQGTLHDKTVIQRGN